MSDFSNCGTIAKRVPSWVPKDAHTYLAHTETGVPLRALAREAGVHASTVLRQVRALEARREDLLVDKALSRLGERVNADLRPAIVGGDEGNAADGQPRKVKGLLTDGSNRGAAPTQPEELSEDQLKQEAVRVLTRLSEVGAVMAVAADMDKAVVVRESETGETTRRDIVEREVAEALALKNWIGCDTPGRVSRYRITADGRAALSRILAETENRALALTKAAEAGHLGQARRRTTAHASTVEDAQRYHAPETPLALLARRRDRSGQKFLPADLVAVGERLREDFEMAELGMRQDDAWDHFLALAERMPLPAGRHKGVTAARQRVVGALRDLGPGLGDIALRCCCYLEGLESIEKRMGWSARSGKIVLRIALQRLKLYYDALGEAGALLG